MALNGLFSADVLRPLDLLPLTDFTYKYHLAVCQVLTYAQNQLRNALSNASSDVNRWLCKVRKMKAVYHQLNLFHVDVSRNCFVAEYWLPTKFLREVTDTIQLCNVSVNQCWNWVDFWVTGSIVDNQNDNDFIYTLGPKGRISEQGYVNAVEKQLKVKIYTQYKQEAQLMLTNPLDAFRGQSRSPNIVFSR